nr:hypothetical protein [uncultured Oscillibacter sp.]
MYNLLVDLGMSIPSAGENAQQMRDRIHASTACREGCVTNGKPITEENTKELLARFEADMPAGSPWDGRSDFIYYSPKFGGGGGATSDAIFQIASTQGKGIVIEWKHLERRETKRWMYTITGIAAFLEKPDMPRA